jgi:hypothetical protein
MIVSKMLYIVKYCQPLGILQASQIWVKVYQNNLDFNNLEF